MCLCSSDREVDLVGISPGLNEFGSELGKACVSLDAAAVLPFLGLSLARFFFSLAFSPSTGSAVGSVLLFADELPDDLFNPSRELFEASDLSPLAAEFASGIFELLVVSLLSSGSINKD